MLNTRQYNRNKFAVVLAYCRTVQNNILHNKENIVLVTPLMFYVWLQINRS